MALCESGHKFCYDCVRLASAEIIGKDKLKFPCLSSTEKCEAQFSLRTLEKVLLKPVYENLVRRIQNDEVTRAFEASKAPNEELVSCPFCHYMTILANTHDSVLTCLNDGCMKSSCRLCKEPSHIPLRCDEVEKKEQTDVRIQLENQMTEALLKSCWKCKRKFYKEEGCNHMTCTCGAQMCYVCGEPLKKNWKDHFGDGKDKNKKCKLFMDTKKFNQRVVTQAGKEALKELKKREAYNPHEI